MVQNIIKRDGRVMAFDDDKIRGALKKAVKGSGSNIADSEIEYLTQEVVDYLSERYSDYYPTVEQVQDVVEKKLMENGYSDIAKHYILYRDKRTKAREMNTNLMGTLRDLTFTKSTDSDNKRENANINTDTAMGVMLKYGSESSKTFTDLYVLKPEQAKAHAEGDIHIHDKDFYNLTETCMTMDTNLIIKRNGKVHKVTAAYFDSFLKPNASIQVEDISNIQILSRKGKFVDVKSVMRRPITSQDIVFTITTKDNLTLRLTSEHQVPVKSSDGAEYLKTVEKLVVGELLFTEVEDKVRTHEIISVKIEGYNGYVYDLETEDHYFNANGILIHNCCQIGLKDLLARGFYTGHGWLRTPSGIGSAASLACIAIQSNQNDMHGGQSIYDFDYGLAPYVAKSFVTEVINHIEDIFEEFDDEAGKEKLESLKNVLKGYLKEHTLIMNEEGYKFIKNQVKVIKPDITKHQIKRIFKKATLAVDRLTYQAMEAVVHNLNTMQSRAGSQVPFSSLNFGSDTTEEGRMVTKNFLLATKAGLGHGETAIFPVSIFKVKDDVNFYPNDPNYDLFELACEVTAERLFPNFEFLDAPFNIQYYVKGKPETEVATMGCVEKYEVITYKIDDKLYVESFWRAYAKVSLLKAPEHFSEKSDYIDVSDLNISVYDSNAKKFVKVKKFIKNKDINDWYAVKTKTANLVATGNHPLSIVGKGRVFVEDIAVGDKVYVADRYVDAPVTESKVINKDNAFIIGAMAQGLYFVQSNYALLSISDYYLGKLQKEVNKLGLNIRVETVREKGMHNETDILSTTCFTNSLSDYTAEVRLVFEDDAARAGLEKLIFAIYGSKRRKERSLPSDIFSVSKEVRTEFLKGFFAAGAIYGMLPVDRDRSRKFYRYDVYAYSKELILQITWLFNSIGVAARCSGDVVGNGKYIKRFYILTFSNLIPDDFKEWYVEKDMTEEEVKFRDAYYKSINVQLFDYDESNPFEETDEIISINRLNYVMNSYDVETESDRFDVSGIMSHNCRTRVIGNTYDKSRQIVAGRGNLSFTSINLPRLGIEAHGDIQKFYTLLDEKMDLVIQQLLDRFEIQCSKHVYNYPMLMGNGVWIDSDKLNEEDSVAEVLKHGTLSVGFIGLAECLVALIGKHHGESEEAQKLGLEIVGHMRKRLDAEAEKRKLNFGLLGTPAEG